MGEDHKPEGEHKEGAKKDFVPGKGFTTGGEFPQRSRTGPEGRGRPLVAAIESAAPPPLSVGAPWTCGDCLRHVCGCLAQFTCKTAFHGPA